MESSSSPTSTSLILLALINTALQAAILYSLLRSPRVEHTIVERQPIIQPITRQPVVDEREPNAQNQQSTRIVQNAIDKAEPGKFNFEFHRTSPDHLFFENYHVKRLDAEEVEAGAGEADPPGGGEPQAPPPDELASGAPPANNDSAAVSGYPPADGPQPASGSLPADGPQPVTGPLPLPPTHGVTAAYDPAPTNSPGYSDPPPSDDNNERRDSRVDRTSDDERSEDESSEDTPPQKSHKHRARPSSSHHPRAASEGSGRRQNTRPGYTEDRRKKGKSNARRYD